MMINITKLYTSTIKNQLTSKLKRCLGARGKKLEADRYFFC